MEDHHHTTRECVTYELLAYADHFSEQIERGEPIDDDEWAYAKRLQAWLRENPEPEPTLTGLAADREELGRLRDEWNALWEARVLVVDDVTDYAGRGDRLAALDARMRELRDLMTVYEAAVAIASLDVNDKEEGQDHGQP
jgi:hypothetical protein